MRACRLALPVLRAASRGRLPLSRPCVLQQDRGMQSSPAEKYTVDDVSSWMKSELAVDVTVLDVREVMDRAAGDFLLFATARSHAHMRRLAKTVLYELKERRVTVWNNAGAVIEGADSDEWMLVDGGSVVVNVMMEEARTRLGLVEHWKQMGARVYHEDLSSTPALGPTVDSAAAAVASSASPAAVLETDPVYLEDGDDFEFEEAEGDGLHYEQYIDEGYYNEEDVEYESYAGDEDRYDGDEAVRRDNLRRGSREDT